MIAEQTKLCSTCRATKPLSEFTRDGNRYRRVCRECHKQRCRALRDRHPYAKSLQSPLDDTRPHVYAAKVASEVLGYEVTPEWVREQCAEGRRRENAKQNERRLAARNGQAA